MRAIAGSLGWALIVSSSLIVGIVPRAFAQDNAPTAQEDAALGAEQNAPPGARNAHPVPTRSLQPANTKKALPAGRVDALSKRFCWCCL